MDILSQPDLQALFLFGMVQMPAEIHTILMTVGENALKNRIFQCFEVLGLGSEDWNTLERNLYLDCHRCFVSAQLNPLDRRKSYGVAIAGT